jgi:hypothetical protein
VLFVFFVVLKKPNRGATPWIPGRQQGTPTRGGILPVCLNHIFKHGLDTTRLPGLYQAKQHCKFHDKEPPPMTTVYWLQGGGCGGDTYSLLSSDFMDVSTLFTTLGLKLLWHPSLSGIDPAAHDRLLSDIDSGTTALDILMVEGSVIFGPSGTGMFDTFRGPEPCLPGHADQTAV